MGDLLVMAVEGSPMQVLRTIIGIEQTQFVWIVRKGSSVISGGRVRGGM